MCSTWSRDIAAHCMYWNLCGWLLSTITGVDQSVPSLVEVERYTAEVVSSSGALRCIQVAYSVPSTGSAVILGVSLQRNPAGEPELNDMVSFSGTVTMVPDSGKLTPPSVERVHI